MNLDTVAARPARSPKSKLAGVAAALALTLTAAACGSDGNDKVAADGGLPDLGKAKTQAEEFYTIGMVDDWNNYGPAWQGLFDEQGWKYNGFSSKGGAANRSNNDDASSADVLTEFASTTGGKVPVCGDIGIAFAPTLEEQKLGMAYTPAGAEDLPDAYHGKDNSWYAHVTGVPTFLVNTDKVENPPTSWADLKKPEYKGLIAIKDPTESGTAQAMVLAAAAALGEGDAFDLDAAIEFFNELEDAGQFNEAGFDEATFETGETPIFIGYDFTNLATQKAMKQTGVNASVTVPTDGSIFAPSAAVCNAKTDKPDLAKAFLDYLFTDEGQKILAQSGGHPIRVVTGDLALADEDKAGWLPEEQYDAVEEFTGDSWPSAQEIAQRWTDEVLNK
jgi:putative spermidine/putrescine transport system substrate-binding protein